MIQLFGSQNFELYTFLLKNGSFDNVSREFSLAELSWVMRHYTILFKCGKCTREFLGPF